jgi:hypothetical protein
VSNPRIDSLHPRVYESDVQYADIGPPDRLSCLAVGQTSETAEDPVDACLRSTSRLAAKVRRWMTQPTGSSSSGQAGEPDSNENTRRAAQSPAWQVLAHALEIVDADGVGGLSMGRLPHLCAGAYARLNVTMPPRTDMIMMLSPLSPARVPVGPRVGRDAAPTEHP